jgi:hypothetical protein
MEAADWGKVATGVLEPLQEDCNGTTQDLLN